jgi:hypothetical protein
MTACFNRSHAAQFNLFVRDICFITHLCLPNQLNSIAASCSCRKALWTFASCRQWAKRSVMDYIEMTLHAISDAAAFSCRKR